MTDTGSRGRARIGVLVPFTNTNLEADLALIRPTGYSFHFARLGGYDADEIPDDAQMAGLGASDVVEPLRLISGVRPDVVLYGCTSATLTHGLDFDRSLTASMRQQSGAKSVTAAGALVFALNAMKVRRIGLASPYVGAINAQAVAFLESAGVHTLTVAEVGEQLDNYGQGALRPEDVKALAMRAAHEDADAIVLSCTDMRSVEAVDAIEQTMGKPVITSNQAMLFQAMRLLGHETAGSGVGRLFAEGK
ncbi:MAG: Asp/Glu racemase [Pseudomonadota bacterium]